MSKQPVAAHWRSRCLMHSSRQGCQIVLCKPVIMAATSSAAASTPTCRATDQRFVSSLRRFGKFAHLALCSCLHCRIGRHWQVSGPSYIVAQVFTDTGLWCWLHCSIGRHWQVSAAGYNAIYAFTNRSLWSATLSTPLDFMSICC